MFDKLPPEQKEAALNAVKATTVWGTVGITSWSELASALAAVLSALYIVEWLWKKLIRPFAERRGWVRLRRRRLSDWLGDTGHGGLDTDRADQ